MWARDAGERAQRRVVWGAEPERKRSVFRDIGGSLPPGVFTGGVRTDLVDEELPTIMFEGAIEHMV